MSACVALFFGLFLWIVALLWQYNTVTIFELSLSFAEKKTLQIVLLTFYVFQQGDNTEAYLEPGRNLRSDVLRKQLLTINYFCKTAFSQIFGQVLNMPLQQLETCCLTDYSHHQTMSLLHVAVIVYFDVLHLVTERSSHWRWSVMFSKISQNLQESTCAGVSIYQFNSQSMG